MITAGDAFIPNIRNREELRDLMNNKYYQELERDETLENDNARCSPGGNERRK